MDFFRLYLRGVALVPSVVAGTERLHGAKSGTWKKDAALSIVQASIHVIEAVQRTEIVDEPAFVKGLGATVDGVVACFNASAWHEA